MPETFQEYIAQERERLSAEREAIFVQQQELKQKLSDIERELVAIQAYEEAKERGSVQRAHGSRSGKRGRAGRREIIIAMLQGSPTGLSRGEILAEMGIKGDKSAEASVSNDLRALSRSDRLVHQGRKYLLGNS